MAFHYFSVFIIDNEFSHHILDLSISNRTNISLLSYISSLFVNNLNGLSNGENLTDISHRIKNIILSPNVQIYPNHYQQRLDIDESLYYQIDVAYYGNIFEEINFETKPLKRISIYNNISNIVSNISNLSNISNISNENNENCQENNENNEKEENILNVQTRLYQYVAIFCFFQQIVTPFLTN